MKKPPQALIRILCCILLPSAALILESLPYGAVCKFAVGPGEAKISTFSYFSPIPYGYANFAPMVAGVLTVILLLLGIVSLIVKTRTFSKAQFWLSLAAFIATLLPAAYGAEYINGCSMAISALLLAQCIRGYVQKKI